MSIQVMRAYPARAGQNFICAGEVIITEPVTLTFQSKQDGGPGEKAKYYTEAEVLASYAKVRVTVITDNNTGEPRCVGAASLPHEFNKRIAALLIDAAAG